MLVYFHYDISKNKSRKNISDILLEYGLYRIQLSVFFGKINKNEFDEIILRVEEFIGENDKFYALPIDKSSLKEGKFLGRAFDMDLVTGEAKSYFL